MKELVENMVQWLQQQVKEAGVKGLLVGVSGGLDSAVVAHLIKRAAPDHSLGVIMPCKSNPTDIKHANDVVASCNINDITVDLTATHDTLFTTISQQVTEKQEWQEANERLADANLRARLRMSTLYTLATNYNYLVVGTDNAAEWYTGYFTKYGDGGVDILPMVELTKQKVREVAEFVGVPDHIIHKKPSADLWEGQTDEAEMGTSYDVIDAYLQGRKIPEKDKALIEKLHKRTEHKRNGAKHFHIGYPL
ncbi:NAD(+) synthase [Lentibacillus sp. L22]|uniref:NAD(+) synthase n=1 Tax=Lentibacillus sp. L22 TaxID=3163028 RepID=UPI003465DBF3